MTAEEFEFMERYLREQWAQESLMNEVDQDRAIENLKKLFEVEEI